MIGLHHMAKSYHKTKYTMDIKSLPTQKSGIYTKILSNNEEIVIIMLVWTFCEQYKCHMLRVKRLKPLIMKIITHSLH